MTDKDRDLIKGLIEKELDHYIDEIRHIQDVIIDSNVKNTLTRVVDLYSAIKNIDKL